MSKTICYLRVSTNHQDLQSQKYEILNYCQKNDFKIDQFIETATSSRKNLNERQITLLNDSAQPKDRIIVSELSRLGRSTAEVLNIINTLVNRDIEIHCIKQNLRITKEGDIQSKVIVTMFSLFAELERDLISQRTKRALEARRAAGQKLGRPKGALGKSKLDGKEVIISEFIDKKVSIAFISKILEVSRGTVNNFIKSRGLPRM